MGKASQRWSIGSFLRPAQWLAADLAIEGVAPMALRHSTGSSPISPCAAAGWALLGTVVWLFVPAAVCAQMEGVPTQTYRLTFNLFYDGNYKDALVRYQDEWRSASKIGQVRWIDSICYATMIGECYYHMGHLVQALENYTTAINLYLSYSDWMLRAQFRPIQAASGAPQAPWGVSTRGSRLGNYPQRTILIQGRIDTTLASKGIVQQPTGYPVEVQEIVRCTVLAIRRRTELLGPLARYDALNKRLLAAVSQVIGPRNHWSQAYTDMELAAALLANGKAGEAVPVLTRSTVAGGEFDHPLTATALLQLGHIALQQGNNPVAAKAFFEATIAAFHSEDLGALGVADEAFRGAALANLVANKKGMFPPLAPAAQWAQAKKWRQLRASLLLAAAEGLLAAGQTAQANPMLDDAQATIARRSLANGWIGAWLNYLRAVSFFQQRKVDLGDQALGATMNYMRTGSHWLFHIAQVDTAFMASLLPSRNAIELYEEVLRDPQPADWALTPVESLAVLSTPHPDALEHWFLAALQRTDREAAVAMALEVSDRARRHRFFSTLAFGGRLHALRWLLEAPAEALDKKTLVQRHDLLADFPAYQAIQQQVKQVESQLTKLPLAPQDTDVARQQSGLFVELAKLSVQQEAILREMAVRRVPADFVFPPLRSTEEIQGALPAGTAVLAFFVAGNKLHAFLLNREKSIFWVVKGAPMLEKRTVALLRDMGNYDANRELTLKELADTQWRQSARQVLDLLTEGSQADFTKRFPELVVVPDGLLWYLPFEALQVSADNRLQPLIARFQMRYAPTVSLAVSDARVRRTLPKTALVLGRLYPRETETAAEASYKEIASVVPETAVFSRPPLPAASALLKTQMGQLIVLEDLLMPEHAPYGWAPMQIERAKPGNVVSDWLALPWGGPDVIVLPGFHTAAENAMKRVPRAAAGADVFLSVCGLMSCGARTLLLSRWRTGGQSSVDLVREFVQELPHTTPADAWQRAVIVVAESKLNLDAEPRIKKVAGDEAPKGSHPFFWAGCMLIDPGLPGEGGPAKPSSKAKPSSQSDAKKPPEAKGPGKPPELQEPKQPEDETEPKKTAPNKASKRADARKKKP